MLDGDALIYGEVPTEVTDFASCDSSSFQGEGMLPGSGGFILGGMYGDIFRIEAGALPTAVVSRGDEVFLDVDFFFQGAL